jgi:hypothetical protein
MSRIDFSKPVSFSIVKAMLENKEFTQLALSQQKHVSLGQVNKIVKYLLEKGFIEKGKSSYIVRNPLAIIEEIAKYRDMKKRLVGKFALFVEEGDLLNMLKEQAVFCLDTALKQYCDGVITSRVCAYVKGDKKKLLEELAAMRGNNTHLFLYTEDLPVEMVDINQMLYTDKVRTIIDLVCDNSAFAASKLFEELWGQKIL